MFKRTTASIVRNTICDKPISVIDANDFKYYDKDGFELNKAEQAYYNTMGYPIDSGILNHCCWQEDWYTLDSSEIFLDHCMLLTRCSYSGEALEQLKQTSKKIPYAQLIIDTPQKWGFDFALDALSPCGKIYEVIHIECDSKDYDHFCGELNKFEMIIETMDWHDAARCVWHLKDKWENLKSFAQNDWKANFLVGWSKAEYTEKSLS